ncbi:MAG TPA: TIGR02266 family protein [Thermoanaerobaculia bacterium]|nr:TIGR02266 family protein [Thermoanaerobaculia bacterium]
MPFETAVRLEFDRFHGFVEQYSANLSLGGMFINGESPPATGSEVAVEFRLGDGFELIRGRGRVVWVSPEGEEPAGFGLRFLELTPGSRELIFRLVERRVREGDPVFDLDERPPVRAVATDEGEDRRASPPWDLPPPTKADDEATTAAPVGGAPPVGDGGRGESPRFGRAASEVEEDEPDDEGSTIQAAAEVDPEVSFAGIVDEVDEVDEADEVDEVDEVDERDGDVDREPATAGAVGPFGGGEAGAPPPADGPSPLDVLPAIDGERPTIGPAEPPLAGSGDEAPATSGAPASGGWPWTEEAGAGSPPAPRGDATTGDTAWPWASPLAEPAGGEVAEPADDAGEAIAEAPSIPAVEPFAAAARASGGRRWAVGVAVGLAVVAIGLFLLLRASAGPQDAGETAVRGGEEAVATPGVPSDRPAAGDLPEVATEADEATAAATGAAAEGDIRDEASGDATGSGPGTIDRIAWERRSGGVDFEIAGAGAIPTSGFDHFRVGGPQPRFVVRIAGVERPYARGAIDVGGPLVARVRTGFHPAAGGAASGSLHVVFDLAPPGSAVATVEAVAGRVRVRFEEP